MEQCATRIFEDSRRTYGSRRLSRELKKAGFDAGRHQTRSVMAKSLCAQALQREGLIWSAALVCQRQTGAVFA